MIVTSIKLIIVFMLSALILGISIGMKIQENREDKERCISPIGQQIQGAR